MTAPQIVTDLVQIQRNCLITIFNYNHALNSKNSLNHRDWKVLIFDKFGEQLITPIFSVKELREFGITLYLNILEEKEYIFDVSAIYFCRASAENINAICNDIQKKAYKYYYLNFIDEISREYLEKLAMASLKSDSFSEIISIYEQYCYFVPLFEKFFSTDVQTSENFTFNGFRKTELSPPQKFKICDDIIDSIISTVISIGQCPWIVTKNRPLTIDLAQRLNSKLKDYINNPAQKSVFLNDLYPDNHLMVYIIERSDDYLPLLLHSWNYSDLINDCFGLSLNKVKISDTNNNNEQSRSISLLPSDSFWQTGHLLVLFDANEQISAKMSKYKKEDEALKNLNSRLSNSIEKDSSNLVDIKSTIDHLPDLINQKQILTTHYDLISNIAKTIDKRKLHKLIDFQEKIQKSFFSENILDELIENLKNIEFMPIDKIRMTLYFVSIHFKHLDTESLNAIFEPIRDMEYFSVVEFFINKLLKKTSTNITNSNTSGKQSQLNVNSFANFSSNLNLPSFSKFFTEKIYNNVNKYIPSQVQCQTVEQLNYILRCNQASSMLSRDFLSDFYICHPKVDKNDAVSVFRQDVDNCKTILIYIVGGGSFYEYQNIHENFKNKNTKVIYGCTSVYNFEQFVKEIYELTKQEQH